MLVKQDILTSDTSAVSRSAFLILLALHDGPCHGLGVVDRVERATNGQVKLGPGTLYGTLHTLAADQMIRESAAPEDAVDDDPRRRYYRITPRGDRALRAEAARLRVLVDAAAARRVLEDA
jgi:DNA-binding PadR family transcriptional regulator